MGLYNQVKWIGIRPTQKTAETDAAKVAAGAASAVLLAANDDRVSFIISNTGTVNVYIAFSATATVNDFTLEPGDWIVCDDYTGAIAGITDGAAGEVRLIEV